MCINTQIILRTCISSSRAADEKSWKKSLSKVNYKVIKYIGDKYCTYDKQIYCIISQSNNAKIFWISKEWLIASQKQTYS